MRSQNSLKVALFLFSFVGSLICGCSGSSSSSNPSGDILGQPPPPPTQVGTSPGQEQMTDVGGVPMPQAEDRMKTMIRPGPPGQPGTGGAPGASPNVPPSNP